MPIIDSKTGKVVKKLSPAELKEAANLMRAYTLVALAAARSGHSGGSLSVMDIMAALYLNKMRIDPKNPYWEDRDRLILSTGHKAPAIYMAMAFAGYFDPEEVMTLRKLGSPFQGHPHWKKLPGMEASTGSLGQGLSIAIGIALRGKLDNKDYRVYCIMGDGEQQEGQIWEAIMEAGHYKLDNLTAIVDKNRLQIDGWVREVMDIDPLADKYRSFGWEVIEIDGHNIEEILEALDKAEGIKGKPTVIIAHTIKGKGVDFMEDQAGWHGKAPTVEQMKEALAQLKVDLPVDKLLAKAEEYQKKVEEKLNAKMPKFSRNYWWNEANNMKVDMEPTRMGFGKALDEIGDDERIIALGCDISSSIKISDFYANHPERKNRFLSMGIAEQSATGVAAGLAKEGKIAVFGTYAVFSAGRNLDQVRTTVCYGDFNVKIAGAHGGVSVGPDGATHQALEDLFQMTGLPNMRVVVPCDSIETKKATKYIILDLVGPAYVRFAREATPIVTTEETPFVFGKANVIRFREEKPRFIDAFETKLESEYTSENEDITIIACGPMVPEAMRAAYILKKEHGIETRIINLHTLKPIDEEAIIRAARDTGVILTAEEHQIGGLGNRVAAVVVRARELYKKPILMDMVGVDDRFGESGYPWELIKEFGLSAEHIAVKAKELYDIKKKG